MKTLLTKAEAMEKGIEARQVATDIRDCDQTTVALIKAALHLFKLGNHIELNFNDTDMIMRVWLDENSQE